MEQGDEPMGDWKIIREYETSIEIDSVDKHLLEVARNEVPIVLNRLKVKMFGGRAKRILQNVSPAQFLQAWMDPNLLGHVKQFINKNVSGDPVSASQILAFIRVELMLSFIESRQAVLELLLEKWFLSPFVSSKAMREGTLNEPNVLSRIGDFLDRESSFRLTYTREYGLVCARGMFYAAFSPNAIVLVEDVEDDGTRGRPPPRLFVVEIKSKCTTATVKKEINLSIRHGIFRTISVALNDGEEDFKQLVPELEYRCQLLHCIACAGLRHAFYVVASLQKIIRIVHVHVGGDAIEQYRLALQEVHNRELSWVLYGKLPSLDGMKLGHAVDVHCYKGIGPVAKHQQRCDNPRPTTAIRTNVDSNNNCNVESKQEPY